MASRDPRGRILVVTCALSVTYAAFVGCGSTDGKRDVRREDGGEAGETTGARPSGGTETSGGNMSNGGKGGSSVIPLGGAGGEPPVIGGGTGGATPIGGSGMGGSAGTSTDLGGAGADAGGNGGDAAGGDAAGGEAGSGGEPSCVPTSGSRITLGFDANNAEWVNNLQWLDSTETLTANLSASGGNGLCGEPTEFFGQAYGAPEGTTPLIIIAGARATRSSCGLDVLLASTPNNCGNTPQAIQWQTEYHFYGGTKADQMRVTRTFDFNETTPKYSGSLRPWQPRVKLNIFANTIYPKGDGSGITNVNVQASCPDDCITPTGTMANQWTGTWFADITASGLALIVRRDPSMTSPVSLTVNYDSFSSGNLSSFLLVQPADGWKAPITEVEYLCMADLTTWPQAERDAAQLPAFCGP